MKKINFENVPSTRTPLNAENMNLLQKNVEEDINLLRNDTQTSLSKIIESGSNSNGNWIKYSDGTMICTKKVEGTVNISQKYYDYFYHTADADYFDLGNYAQEFIEPPALNVNFYGGNSQWIGSMQDVGSLHIAKLHILAPNQKNAGAYYNIIAIGRWK